MDVYGAEVFRIDDLLDFSNDEIFSSSTGSSSNKTTSFDLNHQYHPPHSDNINPAAGSYYNPLIPNCADFTDKLCVPSDDVAELEWLSNFVEDSSNNYPSNSLTGTINLNSNNTSFHSKSRSKRSRATTANTSWASSLQKAHQKPTVDEPNQSPQYNNNNNTMKPKKESSRERSSEMSDIPRKCTHCASEKTPQWRTGPLGPKTLCNACGVRYKSGRLVPEYRPAASPTFVLTQHSNSHRKVMELRRQKEVQQQSQQQGMYGHHFQVC
ncbi:GATA transcription factor 4-like [Nicotiana tabacum]|uniref:GATA transcription factor n=1 Tax=Nicotiana tabacum TaxID=4097 RepID=A0A1S3X1Y6_TOBAC|nr:PREDICTED: GATA transcription factor 4-like [Nicotiana tabacum]